MTFTTTENQGCQPDGSDLFAVTWVTVVLKSGCSKSQAFLLEVMSLQGLSMTTKSFHSPSMLKIDLLALGAPTSGDTAGLFCPRVWLERGLVLNNAFSK